MSSQPKPYITPEQYLEIERKAEIRSEYFQGEMFAMAGAQKEHSLICWNVGGALYREFANRDCVAYQTEMRVLIPATGLYTYPDITVVCGEQKFTDEKVDTLTNPSVIFEVLSPSTESYDRSKKFDHYKTIDSLCEYVLIATERIAVDLYVRRPDGRWLLTSARAIADSIEIPSLKLHLSLSEIYNRVRFETSPPLHP